ncbi:hypothetical protein DPMN_010333 [Dreissena polymorpha]|uniref:Uncharacterized protein n=1 Tax=Dreissena polymorpha TaxID=45954 RepID=A0A9D4N318_DREPO|nr:hypothetical protein DPMN_010333 [Dreissena polymorpha]
MAGFRGDSWVASELGMAGVQRRQLGASELGMAGFRGDSWVPVSWVWLGSEATVGCQ